MKHRLKIGKKYQIAKTHSAPALHGQIVIVKRIYNDGRAFGVSLTVEAERVSTGESVTLMEDDVESIPRGPSMVPARLWDLFLILFGMGVSYLLKNLFGLNIC